MSNLLENYDVNLDYPKIAVLWNSMPLLNSLLSNIPFLVFLYNLYKTTQATLLIKPS